MKRGDDNARLTSEVGNALTLAILAFGDDCYDEVVRLLRPARGIASRFGGSHAQRDVVDLTLIEAARRAGQRDLVSALVAERIATKSTREVARNS